MSRVAFVVAVIGFAGCSTSLECQTTTCTNGKTYKVCAGLTGASYKYDGQSCSCSETNTSACESCTDKVAAYCDGTMLDGGMDDVGTTGACSLTLSGAMTGTYSCSVVGAYNSSSNQSAFSLTANENSTEITIGITLSGLQSGAQSLSSGDSSDGGFVFEQTTTMAEWAAANNTTIPDQGSYSGTITWSGSGPVLGVTGSLQAVAPPVSTSGATGTIDMTVTF